MLSICIPLYNYDATLLVAELHRQALRLGVAFEIIVADDCSPDREVKLANRTMLTMSDVKLIELDHNLGRAALRNYLAGLAAFNNLVFLDCDTFPVFDDFLSVYIANIACDVVVGGIAYRKELPDRKFSLRWHYGHQRESNPAKVRMQKPYASFMTGNFMIKKSVFDQLRFDESISRYGHEDTLFGIAMKAAGVSILHIDNPLFHDGLEPNLLFVEKTKAGIENIHTLLKKGIYQNELKGQIKLVKWFLFVDGMGLSRMFGWVFSKLEKRLLKMLNNKKPNLKIFDLFKLGYLCKISKAV